MSALFSFLQRMFGRNPARFSRDISAVVGRAHSIAVVCGATKVNTAHVLAALALHPRGNDILGGHANEIAEAVHSCSASATQIPATGQLATEDEFKKLIQTLANDALAAPQRSSARLIELHDVVRVLRRMPTSEAYALLQRFGLIGPG